jgi:hypothetical protein
MVGGEIPAAAASPRNPASQLSKEAVSIGGADVDAVAGAVEGAGADGAADWVEVQALTASKPAIAKTGP